MSNLFPNPSIPELLKTSTFSDYRTQFVDDVVEYLSNKQGVDSNEIRATLNEPSELAAQLVDAFCYLLLNKIRDDNTKALNQFAPFAKGDMLDLVVSNLGVTRQTIVEGDENALPVIPAILESDESLLTRYYLAPFALKPGSRKGYEFHARTVGEKPNITVTSPVTNQLVVTFGFPEDSTVSKISDAAARQTAPGEVDITVLGTDGIADADLLSTVSDYLNRDDIKEETDLLTVKAASHVDYSIHIRVLDTGVSTPEFVQSQLTTKLQEFVDSYRRLGATVRPEVAAGVVYSNGISNFETISPAAAIICDHTQAPNCTGITVEIV